MCRRGTREGGWGTRWGGEGPSLPGGNVSQGTTPRARAWGSHLDPREAMGSPKL